LKEELDNTEILHESKVTKLRIELEREVAEWKAKAEDKKLEKDVGSWQREKELLEKQLNIAKAQIEDNKKLFESFKSAIDKNTKNANAEEMQDQAHILEANKVSKKWLIV
jgi:hypothetical protein